VATTKIPVLAAKFQNVIKGIALQPLIGRISAISHPVEQIKDIARP
jgi:hypothetical protein